MEKIQELACQTTVPLGAPLGPTFKSIVLPMSGSMGYFKLKGTLELLFYLKIA
jgi:hypothetical protein